MKYTHILWDWNGTLLDDVICAVDCVNDILESYKLKLTNLSEYYDMMEMDLNKYYSKLIDLNTHSFEEVLSKFQESYSNRIESVQLMDGAESVLESLSKAGAKQFIVSSFEKERLLKYTKRYNIVEYFEEISGADNLFAGRKSDRANNIIKDIDRSKVVFIGDSSADYETAKNINCDCILIAKGHQSKTDLLKYDCTVIDDISEVLQICL